MIQKITNFVANRQDNYAKKNQKNIQRAKIKIPNTKIKTNNNANIKKNKAKQNPYLSIVEVLFVGELVHNVGVDGVPALLGPSHLARDGRNRAQLQAQHLV